MSIKENKLILFKNFYSATVKLGKLRKKPDVVVLNELLCFQFLNESLCRRILFTLLTPITMGWEGGGGVPGGEVPCGFSSELENSLYCNA